MTSEVEPSTLLKAKLTALRPTPKFSTNIDSFLTEFESKTYKFNESASVKKP